MFFQGKVELDKYIKKPLGFLICGGLSRRMGSDKALKKIGGKSLTELVISRSTIQVDDLLINSNEPKTFEKFRIHKVISDCIPGNLGPLVGILTGLRWAKINSNHNWVCFFPIDCPFFPKDLVKIFCKQIVDEDIIMAASGKRAHPVFSMWNIKLEKSLERFLLGGGRKIDLFTKKIKTRLVNFPFIGYDPFFNVNNKDDLAEANKLFKILKKEN